MRRALHFGYDRGNGHVLQLETGANQSAEALVPDFPRAWVRLMDTGLLRNAGEPDQETGRVLWACGAYGWHAFVWWNRSGDKRPNSNSGFYVNGFDFTDDVTAREAAKEAFAFACERFPWVVARQKHALRLIVP